MARLSSPAPVYPVMKHRFKYATITAIDRSNDTANIKLEDGTEYQDVPIFYHCNPDAEERGNGALVGAAQAFSLNDEVIVRFEDGLPLIVGRSEGVRSCATGAFYFLYKDHLYLLEIEGGEITKIEPVESFTTPYGCLVDKMTRINASPYPYDEAEKWRGGVSGIGRNGWVYTINRYNVPAHFWETDWGYWRTLNCEGSTIHTLYKGHDEVIVLPGVGELVLYSDYYTGPLKAVGRLVENGDDLVYYGWMEYSEGGSGRYVSEWIKLFLEWDENLLRFRIANGSQRRLGYQFSEYTLVDDPTSEWETLWWKWSLSCWGYSGQVRWKFNKFPGATHEYLNVSSIAECRAMPTWWDTIPPWDIWDNANSKNQISTIRFSDGEIVETPPLSYSESIQNDPNDNPKIIDKRWTIYGATKTVNQIDFSYFKTESSWSCSDEIHGYHIYHGEGSETSLWRGSIVYGKALDVWTKKETESSSESSSFYEELCEYCGDGSCWGGGMDCCGTIRATGDWFVCEEGECSSHSESHQSLWEFTGLISRIGGFWDYAVGVADIPYSHFSLAKTAFGNRIQHVSFEDSIEITFQRSSITSAFETKFQDVVGESLNPYWFWGFLAKEE